MHIANGKSRERALAGREAFELDRREGHHPAAQIAVGAALAGGAIVAALVMGRRHERCWTTRCTPSSSPRCTSRSPISPSP
jgi:benzodiazapine receptor